MLAKTTVTAEKEKIAKLDEKDKKILYMLSVDAKVPVTRLAKEVGLSKDAVSYRINRLIEQGAILYFIPIINIQKFGFFGYYLYLQLENLKENTDTELLNYLKLDKRTAFVGSCFGGYDIVVHLFARNALELEAFLKELRGRYDSYIRNFVLLLATKDYKLPAKYLAGPGMPNIGRKEKVNTEQKGVDQKDIQLLKILAKDAKTQTYKIANELGLSSDAVLYRVKNLVASHVIERFIAAIDTTKLGYRWHIILLQLRSLTDEKEKVLSSFIKSHPNMLYFTRAVGKYDLAIDVNAQDEKHFNDILMELRIKFQEVIKTYDTILMFEEYKYTYFPEVLWEQAMLPQK